MEAGGGNRRKLDRKWVPKDPPSYDEAMAGFSSQHFLIKPQKLDRCCYSGPFHDAFNFPGSQCRPHLALSALCGPRLLRSEPSGAAMARGINLSCRRLEKPELMGVADDLQVMEDSEMVMSWFVPGISHFGTHDFFGEWTSERRPDREIATYWDCLIFTWEFPDLCLRLTAE